MILFEGVAGRVSDVRGHLSHTLVKVVLGERLVLKGKADVANELFHIHSSLSHNLIDCLEALVDEDLVSYGGENHDSNQCHKRQIEHLSCPDWIRVIEGLVVAVTYSRDSRGDQIERLEVAA